MEAKTMIGAESFAICEAQETDWGRMGQNVVAQNWLEEKGLAAMTLRHATQKLTGPHKRMGRTGIPEWED
jgi:hypothetical protein